MCTSQQIFRFYKLSLCTHSNFAVRQGYMLAFLPPATVNRQPSTMSIALSGGSLSISAVPPVPDHCLPHLMTKTNCLFLSGSSASECFLLVIHASCPRKRHSFGPGLGTIRAHRRLLAVPPKMHNCRHL